jgi:hypothetical protein
MSPTQFCQVGTVYKEDGMKSHPRKGESSGSILPPHAQAVNSY